MLKTFGENTFKCLGKIEFLCDADGQPKEYRPQYRYEHSDTVPLHAYGHWPFCKFRMAKGNHSSGVYIVTVDEDVVYVGECVNADKRWGSTGYGNISPRNPHVGGQATNCRLNSTILSETKSGKYIQLWFSEHMGTKQERLATETRLIKEFDPIWNVAKRDKKSKSE